MLLFLIYPSCASWSIENRAKSSVDEWRFLHQAGCDGDNRGRQAGENLGIGGYLLAHDGKIVEKRRSAVRGSAARV